MKTNRNTAAAAGTAKNIEVDTTTSFFMHTVQTYFTDEAKLMSVAICAKLDQL